MRLIILSLACVTGFGLGYLVSPQSNTSARIERREPAQVTSISFKALQTTLQINKGQVVVLKFWGSWCGPCRQSMPELMRVAEKYKSARVITIALNDTEAAAGRLLSTYPASRLTINYVYTGDLSDLATSYTYPGYIPYMILLNSRGDVFPYSETKLVELLSE